MAGKKAPLISVVIVSYNSGRHLYRCLTALQKQNFESFEAIIVDNASGDTSLAQAQRLVKGDKRFRFIKNKENMGFAAANNQAAAIAKGTWLSLLNPDAFPKRNWLTQFKKAMERYPEFTVFGSTQIVADDHKMLDGSGDMYYFLGIPYRSNFMRPLTDLPEDSEVFGPCAAASFYLKAAFDEVGGFDESFFCYCEDVDLAFRLRLLGHRCMQLKSAQVYHVGSAISSTISGFATYHSVRNRIWVFMKNMPYIPMLALFPIFIVLQAYMSLRFAVSGDTVASFRGLRDGFLGIPSIMEDRKALHGQCTVSTLSILRTLTYSPFKLLGRRIDVIR